MARIDTALRTLDALHLAVAHRHDLVLVTADRGLVDAGRAFGVGVDLMSANDSL
jgi:predicted nucleic acid-binding protein